MVTGVAAGTDTINYSVTTNGCTSTATNIVTVNPLPAAIGGTKTVCELSNRTLTDVSTPGTWSIADASLATIGSSTGVMHGLVNGFTTVTYTLNTGCLTTTPVTVYVTPHAGPITGVSALNSGDVITLSDVPVGGTGTWKSCNSNIASINSSTGELTGMADGITIITYSVPSAHCGTARAFATITVGNCTIASTISTFAGMHVEGNTGNGGAATGAEIGIPYSVAADGVGNVYIADYEFNVVRKVNAAGTISTFAGTGVGSYNGDNIQATSANLFHPAGVTIDPSGNLLIADQYNERIRKVNMTTGIITTIAGNGLHGGWNGAGFGYGGQATNAPLDYPASVAEDCAGNIYIADWGSETVRKINASGIISNFAGTHARGYNADGISAVTAQLARPTCVAVDCSGNVFIADSYNNRVRKVNASGIISTVAGTGAYGYSGDGGAAMAAQIAIPNGVTLDACGNLYICDYNNNAVRKLATDGTISTVAGNNTRGYNGDGGNATAAQIYLPSSLAIDGKGNVYIAEVGNYVVRFMGTLPYAARRFAAGTTQTINMCGKSTVDISAMLAVPDTKDGLQETWTIIGGPARGTLGGFNATAVSRNGVTTPTGLTYTPTNDTNGTDQFTIELSDGITRAATTINVNINAMPNAGAITGNNNTTRDGAIELTNPTGDKNGVWSSSNTSIAVVDNNGKVTGINNGMATIAYTVTNSCGTQSTSARIAISSSELLQQKVNLYPNPNSGSFTCEFNSSNDCQLELVATDVTGRVVYTQPVTATEGPNVVNITLPTNLATTSILFVTLGNSDTQYIKTKVTIAK